MSKNLKLLFLGDVFGEAGRSVIKHLVPKLKQEKNLDLVFANAENAAAGRGISEKLAKELTDAGVDFMTSGNHIYHVKECYPFLDSPNCPILRPYNFPKSSPGRGTAIVKTKMGLQVGLINLMGRLFMEPGVNLPFQSFDDAFLELQSEADVIVLDFHAEATSEKRAMGWYVDGKVQLMVGSHTHVQTADEEILPNGTAFITDLGMTGPYDSVIGMEKEVVLKRFRDLIPGKFTPAKKDLRLCGVISEIDVQKKRAVSIERVCLRMEE